MVPELKTCQRGSLKSDEFPCLKRVGFLGQEKHRGMYTIPEIRALPHIEVKITDPETGKTLEPGQQAPGSGLGFWHRVLVSGRGYRPAPVSVSVQVRKHLADPFHGPVDVGFCNHQGRGEADGVSVGFLAQDALCLEGFADGPGTA